MNEALKKHCKTLELDKILAALSEKASVAAAKELALALEPTDDYDEAKKLLTRTDDAYRLISFMSSPSFGNAKDVTSSVRRAQSSAVLSMRELLDVAEVLRVSRSLSEWRERCEGCEAPSLESDFNSLYINRYLEDRILNSILSEDEMSDTASPTLSSIRRKIRQNGQSVRDKLEKIVRSPSAKYLQDAIVTQRDGRFVVPVKTEHKNELPGLVHDTSSSGATVFIEPMAVVELNNEIRILKSKEKDEMERILAEISSEVSDFSEGILQAFEGIVKLDLTFAKANLAFDMAASLPVLNTEGKLYLKNARHPLLNKRTAVPITVSLGIDYDTLVITGPNTGGKTVTLKTIGLLTLMACCGLLIPASDGSMIPVCDAVLADIGDEQSIEQSFSTFSAHMTNIVSIIGRATPFSLVLIDELGAGTDPVEGAALAAAILMKLRKNGVHTAATTHYAELKSYAIETDGVMNACCEFDPESLRPTYRLIIGAPGRSNAFAISKRLGLSDDIIETAAGLVSENDKRFENVISALDKARAETEKEREEAEKLRIGLEELKRRHSDAQRTFDAEKRRIMDKARDEARNIVERTRARSQQMLDELDELRKSGDITEQERIRRAREAAKKGLADAESIADPVDKQNSVVNLPRELKAGDTVELINIGKRATVIEPPRPNGTVTVMAGIVKTSVRLSELRLIESPSATVNGAAHKGTRKVSGLPSRADRTASSEIDLRGMNTEEALMEVDRYIDNAVLSGIELISIIHGKGTGTLRKAVQEHLRHNKYVKSFRLGVFGEGENGVTIVELK